MRSALAVQARASVQPTASAAGPRGSSERRPLITGRRQLLGVGLGAGLCLCCPPPPPALADAAPAAAPVVGAPPPAPAWGYSCLTGPETWEGACAAGIAQSPIGISFDSRRPPRADGLLDTLNPKFPRYIKEGATVKNTGHGTMQVDIPEGIEYELAGYQHRLLQFHFHTPSEHAISGRHTAMEAHLVHRNLETGNLAVLGVMIEAGEDWLPNPCIAEALRSAPAQPGASTPLQNPISLRTMLPRPRTRDGMRPYVNYAGSLTTPPCSTGVDWYVFLDTLQVDPQQILDFMFYAGGGRTTAQNARPVQPLGDRQVRYFV